MAAAQKPKAKSAASKTTKQQQSNATQHTIDIAEIRDDIVILRDGTLRGVILVSSINFALKSEDEQKAIIQSYMQFLNTFESPIQIVIQSRKLNIDEYLGKLDRLAKEQTNDLLRIQTAEYRQFIMELIDLSAIMSKRFYVVVPYSPISEGKKMGFIARIKEAFAPTEIIRVSQEKFVKYRTELQQRMDHVISGLEGMSLKAVPLDTQSLIEIYYNSYNPDTFENQKIVDIEKINLE